MKKIYVLTTGGTIASKKNEQSGLLASGSIEGEELIFMEDLSLDIDIKVESFFQIPSNHMSFDRLIKLRDRIKYLFDNKNVDGVVVTHGTDTLEETAYFLDLTINSEKPIVVTGSQRSPMATGTDAFTNIRQSILVATNEKSKNIGTVVVFNEKIFCAKYVKKIHSYNVNAFDAFGYGYLGYIDKNDVYIYQTPVRKEHYVTNNKLPRVDIVTFPLDADGSLIEYLVDNKNTKGIIIEGSGRGHISPKAVDSISKATENGIKVVLTTDCEEGRVHPIYDFAGGVNDLINRGVIIGKDYNSKKARVKLAVLLGSGIIDKERIEKAFSI